jgi:hypothetical protein
MSDKDLVEVPTKLEACQVLIRKLQATVLSQRAQLQCAQSAFANQQAIIANLQSQVQRLSFELRVNDEASHSVNVALAEANRINAQLRINLELCAPSARFGARPNEEKPVPVVDMPQTSPVSASDETKDTPAPIEPTPIEPTPIEQAPIDPAPIEQAPVEQALEVMEPTLQVMEQAPIEQALEVIEPTPIEQAPTQTIREPPKTSKGKEKRSVKAKPHATLQVSVENQPENPEVDELVHDPTCLARERQSQIQEEERLLRERQRKAVEEQRVVAKNNADKRAAKDEERRRAAMAAKAAAEAQKIADSQAKKDAKKAAKEAAKEFEKNATAATFLQANLRRFLAKNVLVDKRAEAQLQSNKTKMVVERYQMLMHRSIIMKIQNMVIKFSRKQMLKKEKKCKQTLAQSPVKEMQASEHQYYRSVMTLFAEGSPNFPYIKPYIKPYTSLVHEYIDEDSEPIVLTLQKAVMQESIDKLIEVCNRVFTGTEPVKPSIHPDMTGAAQNDCPYYTTLVQLKIEAICWNIFLLNKCSVESVNGNQLYYLTLQLPFYVDYKSPEACLTTIAGWFDNDELKKASRPLIPKAIVYRDDEETSDLKTAAVKRCVESTFLQLLAQHPKAFQSIEMREVKCSGYSFDNLGIALRSVILHGESTRRVVGIVEVMEWFARGVIKV